ncbi:MAG: PUA domain-containing protein, partial [Pseudomonadales bacterium]
RQAHALTSILAGRPIGTLLAATVRPLDARKRWIAGHLKPSGTLLLDAGAAKAIQERGVSLLPVGVIGVEGEFGRGELVRCVDEDGTVIAQGLVNYASLEVQKLLGAGTEQIGERLGYVVEPELMHRDNLVVV